MRTFRPLLAATLMLAALLAVPPPISSAADPIQVVPVRTGIGSPMAFTVADDGRIWFVSRKSGAVRIYDPVKGSTRLFTDIVDVDGHGERGAIGLALHPDYPATPFVYVNVTTSVNGVVRQQLIRFKSDGAHAIAQKLLFTWQPSNVKFHNGGRTVFGPDGLLYVMTGDNGDPATSQDLPDLRGKVLRVGGGGAIPATNPFGTPVYAYGIRNSIGMAFDPQTGRLWATDNGPSCNDEIDLIVNGGNFAWGPSNACPADPSQALVTDTNQDGPLPRQLPVTAIADTVGVTGAVFCDACGLGTDVEGDLLFGDVHGDVWDLDLDPTRMTVTGPPTLVLTAPTSVWSMEAGPGGTVFFSGPEGIYRLAPA
jgi:aldose sugar dehydrogenase